MTAEAREAMLRWLLDGAELRLTTAEGADHPARHKLTAADLTWDGPECRVDYLFTFAAAGPPAHGCRLMRGALLVDEVTFADDKGPRPVPVLAGGELRVRPTLRV